MTVQAWRIVRARYADSAFSGEGAKRFGGRWHGAGSAVVYASGSPSLAILETLVHLEFDDFLERFVIFQLQFDASLMVPVDSATLSRRWRISPPTKGTIEIGDVWLSKMHSAILRVPSAIVESEWNYLLNPAHPNFSKITIGPKQPIRFDPRLSKHKN